jgi:hypothetical protein
LIIGQKGIHYATHSEPSELIVELDEKVTEAAKYFK